MDGPNFNIYCALSKQKVFGPSFIARDNVTGVVCTQALWRNISCQFWGMGL